MFWFLLLIFLNSLRSLFIFCVNVEINELLLLGKIYILLNNLRNHFFFCINFNIDEMLLSEKNKARG